MKFYHGTTKYFWNKIQKEGVLWGRKNKKWFGRILDRITYFTPNIEYAGIYNDRGLTKKRAIILEVDFPDIDKWDYWEMHTYDPIPLSNIKRIK